MIQLDVFNDDEKQYLNALVKGRYREKISRQDILKAVAFARDVADGTDTMILDLIDGVYSKVNNLSDSEWEDLRQLLPFPVVISSADLMDVPADEEDDFADTLVYASPDALFYFDPPYKPLSRTSSFNSYAKEEFGDEEQMRLGDFCHEITGCGARFILSNSDVKGTDGQNDFFDDMYKAYHINRVLATRMVNANPDKRGTLTELLVRNYAETWRSEEKRLFPDVRSVRHKTIMF